MAMATGPRRFVLPGLLMKRGIHSRRHTGLRLLGLLLLPGVLTVSLTAFGGHHHGGSPPTTTTSTTTSTSTTTTSTTTTTTEQPTSANQIALGFAAFQPTTQFTEYQSAVGSLPEFMEWFEPWPNSEAGAGTTDATAPLYLGSQAQLMESDNLTPLISWGTNDIPLTDIVNGEPRRLLGDPVALAETYPGTSTFASTGR